MICLKIFLRAAFLVSFFFSSPWAYAYIPHWGDEPATGEDSSALVLYKAQGFEQGGGSAPAFDYTMRLEPQRCLVTYSEVGGPPTVIEDYAIDAQGELKG